MNKKFSFRKILLIIVLTALAVSAAGISYMSISKYNLSADTFADDGYMLLASSDKSSDAINVQHYFNAGESYHKTIDDTVIFTDVNGTKVNAERENFVHYQTGSMNGLAESVVLDADHVNPDEQVSYYSVPEKTTLNKTGNQYTLNNAGNNINLTNFIWKIANDRYMIVSPTVDLVISDESEQNFTDYVELRYIDEGVVHLVTQDGTYSTVSSDAYLELTNGLRIYIGSKNISDGENILMNMSQMVVGSDDNIEVIPDEDYTIENVEQPQIIVNATDGQDGTDGTDGTEGESGKIGINGVEGKSSADGVNGVAGSPGAAGVAGENGENGTDGSGGDPGESGVPGTSGANGVEGNPGESGVTGTTGTTGTNGVVGKQGEKGTGRDNTLDYDPDFDGADGNDGYKGNKGADGKEGTSAPNADVIFEPEVMPLFTDIELETMPYGVIEVMNYDDNDCYVSDAWISIVDVATGNEVWRRNITGDLKAEMGPYECDTLHADTQYRLNIHATYTSPNYPDQTVSQIMAQELFYTDSYGYSLLKKDVTCNSLELKVHKDQESIVKSLRVKIFDENMNELGYADPTDLTTYPIDGNHAFTVYDTPIGDSVPVKINGLNSNTVYYAQIQIMEIESEDGRHSIVPTNSYPLQKYLTKKVDPVLTKPYVRVDDVINSFIVTPGEVIDKDNGVIGYRLEIYTSESYGQDGAMPYYTYNVETPVLTNISVPITDDPVDDTKLHRNVKYKAHIVAIFDDNEETIDFRGPVSDDFITGNGEWPTVRFERISNYITPSTAEGKIVLVDTSGHAFPDTAMISVEYMINESGTDTSGIKNKAGLVTEFKEMAIPLSEFDHNGFEYSYPISLKSLKVNTEYVLTVKASEFYIDGIRHGSPVELETVASTSFRTKSEYSPLLLKENDIRPTDPKYSSSMFAINLQLVPTDLEVENSLRNYSSIVPGLGNLGDLSGRSVTYLRLDLYVGVGEEPDRPINHLKTVYVKDCNNFTKEGAPYKPSYSEPTDSLTPIYGESQYGYLYAFNGSLYDDAYCETLYSSKTYSGNNLGLILTDDIFTDPTTGYNPVGDTDKYSAGTRFFVKVTAYDYTYGLGENYNINGENSNNIKVGIQLNDNIYKVDSYEDAWITFVSNYAVPAIPQSYPYCENYLRLGTSANNVKAQFASDVEYYDDPSDTKIANIHYSNMQNAVKDETKTNKEILESLWNSQGISDSTAVGISYSGPSGGRDGLAQYCTQIVPSVYYNIYKMVYEDGEYKEKLVNTSGPMDYTYSSANPSMPVYTFFYDVVDKTTGLSISRGDKYVIETKLVLKGNEKLGEEVILYPDFWDNNDTLPGKIEGVEHTRRIFDILESSRQVPSILSLPYSATPNNENLNSDEVHLIINDPDHTLVSTEDTTVTFDKVNIYQGEFGGDGKPVVEKNFGTVSNTKDIVSVDEKGQSITTKASIVKGNALSTGNLYAKYSLYEENDRLANYSYIKLISEANIIKDKTVKLKKVVDSGDYSKPIDFYGNSFDDFYYTFDYSYLNIDFRYQTKNVNDENAYEELLGVDVILEKYVYDNPDCKEAEDKTGCTLVPATDNAKMTVFTKPKYDNYQQEVVDDEYVYTHKAKIKIDAIDVADIIKDSDAIDISLVLYYDSGDYGIKYFDSSIGDKTSDYYLIQKANSEGIAISGTEYPKDFYETTKKSGINGIADTTIVDIDTPLFTRDQVTYKLYENKISLGQDETAKDFSISSYGLNGSIIKNVGSTKSAKFRTSIDFIMPIAQEISLLSGYSTAILDFRVLDADTVLRQGTDIEIFYKKKTDDDYSTTDKIVIHYDPSSPGEAERSYLDENGNRIWESVMFEDLAHAEGSSSTEYDYKICGYANDGTVTGHYVTMYEGGFKIQHFEHLFGNLKVETYGDPKTRDTKQLSYSLNFRKIITSDIKKSLTSVTVEIYDEYPTESSKPVSSKVININDVYAAADEEYYENYSYEVKLPWSPKNNHDHEMDDGKKYWLKSKYNYVDGNFDEPYVEDYFSLGENSADSITGWNSFYNLKSYVVTGTKQVEVIGSGDNIKSDYQLKFNITGKDIHRLESIASDNKLTFLVELYDHDKNIVQIKDGKVVSSGGEYQRRIITGVPIGNDGSFTTKGMLKDSKGNAIDNPLLTFGGLKPNSLYHLRVYFVLDGQNIDIPEIVEYLDLTTDDSGQNILTETTIDGLLPPITKGSGVYEIRSMEIRTETDGDLRIDSAILHPESNEAFILGTNMNFVKRIQYVVYKNGTEINQVRLSGSDIAANFVAERYTNDLYYLKVPDLLQDGAAYIIRIDFYGYDGDDWANPTMTAQGVHGVED